MTKDCFGTCPKCGEIGWCHYKGKARIFKSGPGSDLYKVSLFKCGNCGKKFGFELEDGVIEPKLNEEEEDSEDWEKVYDALNNLYFYGKCSDENLRSAYYIARKHCGHNIGHLH